MGETMVTIKQQDKYLQEPRGSDIDLSTLNMKN